MESNFNFSKSRGGQPGNLNALKHGFYSRKFRKREIQDLSEEDIEGLRDEIALMRVMIRRLFEYGGGSAEPKQLIAMLNAIGQAATRIAGMLRIQKLLETSPKDQFLDLLNQAVKDVAEEFGIMEKT